MMRATSFNPRTHTGCDLLQSTAASTQQRFQSTHPHGVRHNDALPAATLKTFQSTHPHGVRPYCTRLYLSDYKFQSTHPHGVRLHTRAGQHCARGVSIHAPTRGATQTWPQAQHGHLVSIHAPTRGATRYGSCPRARGLVSIHAPTRGATSISQHDALRLLVSIHAPTRGATCSRRCIGVNLIVSIHAPTRGATQPGVMLARLWLSFNPRTHTGCDSYYLAFWGYSNSFNPRTHTGCDITSEDHSIDVNVSIHAPTRGATSGSDKRELFTMFQSTHPHGVRLRLLNILPLAM